VSKNGTRGTNGDEIDRATAGERAPRSFQLGAELGHYQLVRCIGQGASGVVYEARHLVLERRVAIKVLQTSRGWPQSGKADRRFVREARSAARIRHPSIVDVYDFGVDGGVAYLVMELVDGESLAQLLRRDVRLEPKHAVKLLLPILSASAELHATGIVHRDIKPANILLARPDSLPKLADFGISWIDDGASRITEPGLPVGTIAYMAPELVRGRAAGNEKSDQYALGVTLYECLAGRKPFVGTNNYDLMQAIVAADPEPPSTYAAEVPASLDEIVLRALAADPSERFACVDDFASALSTLSGDAGRASSLRSHATKRPTARRTRRIAMFAVCAGLGVASLIAVLASRTALKVAIQRPATEEVRTASSLPSPRVETQIESPRVSIAAPTDRPAPELPDPKPARAIATSRSSALVRSEPSRGDNGAPILDVP
jgi:serine/threonine-protein kinase